MRNDPTARAVDNVLRKGEMKHSYLGKACQSPSWFVFSNWDILSRFPALLLDMDHGYAWKSNAKVQYPDKTHPIEAMFDYFKTSISMSPALNAHPEEWEQLARYVKGRVPKRGDVPSLQWECQLYMGKPREKELEPEQEVAPVPAVEDKGFFTRKRNPSPPSR